MKQFGFFSEAQLKCRSELFLSSLKSRISDVGLTQKRLGEIIGVDCSNLSKILSGKVSPTLDTLCLIEMGIAYYMIFKNGC